MTKCKLCLKSTDLKKSHIIPRFIYKYMLRRTGNQMTQFDGHLNLWQRSNRQFTEYLFCGKCEQLLGKNETQFASLFREIIASTDKSLYLYGKIYDPLWIQNYLSTQSSNISKAEIDRFLEESHLHGKTSIIEYFAISYIYREVVRKSHNISQRTIELFRNYLLNSKKFPFSLVLRIHQLQTDFDMTSSVIVLDGLDDFKHFIFYLPSMQFHICVHVDEMPPDLANTVVQPENLFDDKIKTLELIKAFQRNSRKASNLNR